MLTHSMKKKILDMIIGREGEEAYLALSKDEPNAQGGGIDEPVGGGYERVLIGSPNAGIYKMEETQVDSTSGIASSTNDKEIHFNEATTEWGELGWFAIYETATGGTPKYVGQLVSPITPQANNVVIVRVGDISISIE